MPTPTVPTNFFPSSIDEIDISLSKDTVEELFDEHFEGYCPVCRKVLVEESEIVCCGCAEEIIMAHLKQHGMSCASLTIRTLTESKVWTRKPTTIAHPKRSKE